LSNGKSLGSGGFKPIGSLANIIVVVLVVVVLILCAGVFMMYNNEKGANNDAAAAKQAFGALNDSYNDLSGKYTALVANNADLKERFGQLETKYDNVSTDYNSLKNQSDTMTVKVGEFLESEPTVAYNYLITSGMGANNTTDMKLTVNVFNVCNKDVSSVLVKVTIQSLSDNSTGELVKTISSIPSLSSRSIDFTLDNSTRVQSVWVNIN
jgi:uncharacterized protein (UPF0333 family)